MSSAGYPSVHRHDITGKRFGILVAVARVGTIKGHSLWRFACDCGGEITTRYNRVQTGNTRSCGCLVKRTGGQHHRWTGYGEIPGRYWYNIINGAKSRSIAITITIEQAWMQFISQHRRCALTGVALAFAPTCKNWEGQTASLDRIDSVKGYEPANIQWVHKDVNGMKMDLCQARFLELCRQVAEYSKR